MPFLTLAFVVQVSPASGVIRPDQVADILVRHEEFHTPEEFADGFPQSWWSEDTRDKEVVLLVVVRGSCSTETRNHRVHVRHCFSQSKSTRSETSKGTGSRKYQGNTYHRSGLKHGGNSSDTDDHRSQQARVLRLC